MSEDSKKISFGFSKSIKKTSLKNVVLQEEKKVDYIACLDEKAIKVIGEKEIKDEPLVIPLLGSKTWHDRIINKIDADIFEPKSVKDVNDKSKVTIKEEPIETHNGSATIEAVNGPALKIKIEPESDGREKPINTLEEQAAREIIEDLKSQEKTVNTKTNLLLPVVDQQSLRGEAEPTLEDYEQIPVDAFGLAMLRGMGWQPGKGLGKNEKVVAAVTPELRPKGMGLGADKVTLQKQVSKSKEKPVEEMKLEKGTYVKLIAGKQSNNYGQIEGLDDDAGRLIVKMALSGETISVNEFMVQSVTKAEYTQNAKVLNASKFEDYKNKERKKREKRLSSELSDDSIDASKEWVEKDIKSKGDNNTCLKDASEIRKSKQKKHSSDSNTDSDHKVKKHKHSSEKHKTKKSKKNKGQDSSPERSSKKQKKKHKEHKKAKSKRKRDLDSTDRRKHKKVRRSRSNSSSRR